MTARGSCFYSFSHQSTSQCTIYALPYPLRTHLHLLRFKFLTKPHAFLVDFPRFLNHIHWTICLVLDVWYVNADTSDISGIVQSAPALHDGFYHLFHVVFLAHVDVLVARIYGVFLFEGICELLPGCIIHVSDQNVDGAGGEFACGCFANATGASCDKRGPLLRRFGL